MPASISALLIPADDALPVREVVLSADESGCTLDSLQEFVGGNIETIPFPARGDVAPYFNEEGKLLGLPANRRATQVLAASMFADDYVAGDCVLAGFDADRGQTVALPGDFQLKLAEPFELGEPDAVTRRDRTIAYDWLIAEAGHGKRILATLTVCHRRAGVNLLSGARHPNEFTATLSNETEEPASCGGVMRGFIVFSGLGIARQEVARFSAKGLEEFAELSLARVRGLCAAGDERVVRYFNNDEPAG